MEVIKGKQALKIAEYNHKISSIEENSTKKQQPIGFAIISEEGDNND